MTDLVPIRDIAKFGVVPDIDPYDLPVGAWSFGINARFRNNKITRGPVFRSVLELGTSDPRFVVGYSPSNGIEQTFVGYKNGTLTLATPVGETAYSISGYTPSVAEAVWSSAHVGNLIYINREDRVPWYLPSGGAQFAELPNWDTLWRTRLIRASNSALIAFNVTKGATNYPTGIQTSEFAKNNAVPTNWDETVTGTNATFNILADMEGGIVDAQTLHNDVFIYAANETWRMFFSNDQDVWKYIKVFDNFGAINANCSIEVQGKHYVFGITDIWMHDGNTPASIADARVREFIYGSIDISKSNRCFVAHNPQNKEIKFCFIGSTKKNKFGSYSQTGFDGCNLQAVYNYGFNHWTFDDLPYVYSASRCNIDIVNTYDSVSFGYDTAGASYQDQATSAKKPLCYVGDAQASLSLSHKLYAFDNYGQGSIAPFAVDTNANGPFYIERDGIDLDELGADLRGYKCINTLYPQGRIDEHASLMTFTVGASDYFTVSPTYADPQTYDADAFYKLDYNMAGRWLSMQIEFDDYKTMTLTGFDLDIQIMGER